MKKVRRFFTISLMLLLIINISQAIEQDRYGESAHANLSIEATEEQLKILNSIDRESITFGELIEKVFPKESKLIRKASLEKMHNFSYNMVIEDSSNLDIAVPSSVGWWSSISKYGVSINYVSYTGTSFTSPEVWLWSELVNQNNHIVAAKLEIAFNTNQLEASGVAEPPTGTYFTRGAHWWMYFDTYTADWEWLVVGSSSHQMSYVNPF